MKQTKYDQEQKEAYVIGLRESYEFYKENIIQRKESGEVLEVKPYELWVRKANRNRDGIIQEIEVSGSSGETKKARFTRLALNRMNATIAEMTKLMNLGSNAYESTPEQRTKIISILRGKVNELESALNTKMKKKEEFEF